jgi:hypothetical protein
LLEQLHLLRTVTQRLTTTVLSRRNSGDSV